jgi:hypothetical protein
MSSVVKPSCASVCRARRRPARPVPLIILVAFLGLAAGCVHERNIAIAPTQLTSCQKAPVKVALVMGTNFTRRLIQKDLVTDHSVTPIGRALVDYARNVTGSVFSNVVVLDTPDAATGTVDAILIPRVVKVDETYGMWADSKRSLLIEVEWTMKDGNNQGTLWSTSLSGQAEDVMGSAFTTSSRNAKVLRATFDDLSQKTQKALLESARLCNPAPPVNRPQSGALRPAQGG